MRILIAGGAPRRDERGVEWCGHTWYTAWCQYRLTEQRPGDEHVRVNADALEAFVAKVDEYDGVLCESPEALLLLHEWKRRDLAPKFVLALEVNDRVSIDAVCTWYRNTQGIEPWPLLRSAPHVSWLAPSTRQAEGLLQAGISRAHVHRVTFGAASISMLLPDGERLLEGSVRARSDTTEGLQGSVLFAGNAQRDWRTILEAARALPAIPCSLVGGSRRNLEKHLQAMRRSWLPNLTQVDLVPADEFVEAVRGARVVVVSLVGGEQDAGHTTISLAHRLGIPVVCTDVPGVAEYCDHRTAVMVNPGAPQELATAILQAWNDVALRERLVREGCEVERARDAQFRQAMISAVEAAAGALTEQA